MKDNKIQYKHIFHVFLSKEKKNNEFEYLHLHLGHLADAFIQSVLQRVHLLKDRQQYITMVHEDNNRAGFKHS